jgi:hypothetical protein
MDNEKGEIIEDLEDVVRIILEESRDSGITFRHVVKTFFASYSKRNVSSVPTPIRTVHKCPTTSEIIAMGEWKE